MARLSTEECAPRRAPHWDRFQITASAAGTQSADQNRQFAASVYRPDEQRAKTDPAGVTLRLEGVAIAGMAGIAPPAIVFCA